MTPDNDIGKELDARKHHHVEALQSKPEDLKVQVFGSNRYIPVKTDNQGQLAVVSAPGSSMNVTATDLDIRNLSSTTDSIAVTGNVGVTATDLDIRHLSHSLDSIVALNHGSDGTSYKLIATDLEGNTVNVKASTKHSQLGQLYSANLGISKSNSSPIQVGHSEIYLFVNPHNSGKRMCLERIIGGVDNNCLFKIAFFNYDEVLMAEDIDMANWNIGYSGSSSGSITKRLAQTIPNWSDDRCILNFYQETGSFQYEFNGDIIISSHLTENMALRIEVENKGSSDLHLYCTVVWSETPM